jgi:3-hydroxyacyl-CoA dehydrogenase
LDVEFRRHTLGIHFFNPPRYMKLIEVIPGMDTSAEVTAFIRDFAVNNLGKGVIIAKDSPGFIANRISAQAFASAMRLTEQYGYSVVKADGLTGSALGRAGSATFRTADMVGIDTMIHVLENMLASIGDPYDEEQCRFPKYIGELAEAGHLGDKTKAGFYRRVRTESGREKMYWDYRKQQYEPADMETIFAVEAAMKAGDARARVAALVWGDEEENRFAWDLVKGHLLYTAHCTSAIADDTATVDHAMHWGFNWPLGPYELWDAIGVRRSVDRMTAEGADVPDWILEMLESGKTSFYDGAPQGSPYLQLRDTEKNPVIFGNEDASVKDIGDGVACLEFHNKNNTITYGLESMLDKALELLGDSDFKGLVIGSQSKNFCVGADLPQVVKAIEAKDWAMVERLVDYLQTLNTRILHSVKPVVTCAYNMAIGGGAEIAMHGCRQVVPVEVHLGCVETGVGVLPAGGGVKELLIRSCGEELPIAEQVRRLREVWKMIVTAKVSDNAYEAIKMKFLRESDRIVMNADRLIETAKAEVCSLASPGYIPRFRKTVKASGTTGMAALLSDLQFMVDGAFVSEHDALVAKKVASVLTGGDVLPGTTLTEEDILDLEKEAFLSLCGESKTLERMKHMLATGKPLRN